MASPNCIQVLNAYSDFLSNNPNADFPRPHPLFWSSTDCAGNVFPAFDATPTENTFVASPFAPTFGSLYIPANWQVIIKSSTNERRTFCPGATPLLVSDAHFLTFETKAPICTETPSPPIVGTTSVFDDIDTVYMISQVPLTLQPFTTFDWSFQMCNQTLITTVGLLPMTSYAQGSEECDALMEGYCVGSHLDAPECSCLADEVVIANTFCQPGNTDPKCQDAGQFREYIPVLCFGKSCSFQGYRFRRMQDAKCNITMCQQLISELGTDLFADAELSLHCGSKPAEATPTPSVPSMVAPGNFTMESWQVTIAVLGAVVLLVLVPMLCVWMYMSIPKTPSSSQT